MSEHVGAKGRVTSVNLSEKKTMRKQRYERGTLVLDRGFEGDAHAGDWHRQVSLLAQESIDEMLAKGLEVGPGDFAENITTEGVDVMTLPVGSVVRVGDDRARDQPGGQGLPQQVRDLLPGRRLRHAARGRLRRRAHGGRRRRGRRVEIVSLGDGTCERSPEDSLAESESVRSANECRKLEKEAAK